MLSESTTSSNNSLLSKAWIYYEQGSITQTLQQTVIPINTQLESNEVIVEIKAVAINPVDIQLGNISQWIANWLLASGMNKAKIPGADFSGIIYKIGCNVTKYKIGDEVFGIYAGSVTDLSARSVFKTIFNLEQRYGSIIAGLLKTRKDKQNQNSIHFLFNDLNLKDYSTLLNKYPIYYLRDGLETLVKH
ncbi:unnamed protein product [Rotaria sp. Silwood2]|nr:unnamed protein product [Rotaria sp. Silwood2]